MSECCIVPLTVHRNKNANPMSTVLEERAKGINIFPPEEDIFRAVELCKPEEAKVVILGQDPYHEAGQANGLAFSVNEGVPLPPSLKNICKEVETDTGFAPHIKGGDLTPWAEQGVLLLNTVLTVREGEANSHKGIGWEIRTKSFLREVLESPNPVVFMLWGDQAARLVASIAEESEFAPQYGGLKCEILCTEKARCAHRKPFNSGNKLFLTSTHPSPLAASRNTKVFRSFIGSKPFTKANEFLERNGAKPIYW